MTDRRTDGRTDGHPKPIGSQPFGLGPKNVPFGIAHDVDLEY